MLQVKLGLKTEISFNFAISSIRPAGRPPTQNSSEKAGTEQNLTKEQYRNVVGPNLEDDLIFFQLKDNLSFRQMEDDLNFVVSGRLQYFSEWKMESIIWKFKMTLSISTCKITQLFWQMKDDLKHCINHIMEWDLATAWTELGTAQPQLVNNIVVEKFKPYIMSLFSTQYSLFCESRIHKSMSRN